MKAWRGFGEFMNVSISRRIIALIVFLILANGFASPIFVATPAWGSTCSSQSFSFTGDGSQGTTSGITYTVESITAVGACNWIVPRGVDSVTVLVVGGGGGGGGGSIGTGGGAGAAGGGGGGAGGTVAYTTKSVSNLATVNVTVGSGGAGGAPDNVLTPSGYNAIPGSAGSNSYFAVSSSDSVTATGGGGGGVGTINNEISAGGDGGSNSDYSGGSNNWEGGGGGAGANGNGSNGTDIGGAGGSGANGGIGRSISIALSASAYGGGGGGGGTPGDTDEGTAGSGGTGGGGQGGIQKLAAQSATAGANGLGGGGGGGAGYVSASTREATAGESGGSGVVVIRYTVNTSLGVTSDVTVSRAATLSDSATVFNSRLTLSDSMTISGFETQTIRVTVSTDTGTVNITYSTRLSKATGSGYANAGDNAITAGGSTIAFEGSTSDVQAALDTLKLNLPTSRTSSFSGSATVTISVSFVGGVPTAYNSDNRSFYRNFGSSITWQAAMDLTTASSNCGITFNGLCGYLATVTSETETAFIADKVTTAASWIGGNDTATEGTWRWPYNSPEAGAVFFKDSANNPGDVNVNYCADGLKRYCPAAVTGNISRYNNWNDGEPNEFGSGEDALQILSGSTGRWNDLPSNSSTLPYIIEFGGKTGEAVTYQSRTRNVIVNFSYAYSTGETTAITTSSCPSISITSLTPAGGSSFGGTRLTISGQGLTSSVYINGRIADVRLSSSTSVIVLTPPGPKGSATLRIDGCNASATSTYLYDPDPVISSLTSSSISTTGGVVTITGTFLSGASITIGTTRAIISANTDALITAVLSASSAGEKTMTLTTDFGSTTSKLIYLDPPSLNATLSPPYIAQGDAVSISFAATGATSYSSSVGLPKGLFLNPSTGLLSGTAIKEGIYNFSITATNAVGSDTKSYNLDIDRPTPKAISTNLYFAHKNTSLSASNKASLNRLIARVKAVTPRNLSATITMTGGSGNTKNSLAPTRHDQIKAYLDSQGIQSKTSRSNIGSANKIVILVSWERE